MSTSLAPDLEPRPFRLGRNQFSRRLAGAVAVTALPSFFAQAAVAAPAPVPAVPPPSVSRSSADPFTAAQLSIATRPALWSGQIATRAKAAAGAVTTSAVTPAPRGRVDVYLIPTHTGPLLPLTYAITDATGNFSLAADAPADLAAYQLPGGLINASVVYSELASKASRLGHEQLKWDASARRWVRVTPPDPETGRNGATVLDVPTTPGGLSNDAKAAAVTASYTPACRPYYSSTGNAVAVLPMPPTWINVFTALAEDRPFTDWAISGDYQTAASTYTDNHSSVAVTAGFATQFPGVNLNATGESLLTTGTGSSSNTALGFGFDIEAAAPVTTSAAAPGGVHASSVALGRTLNLKYGVEMNTNARLYECYDIGQSYINGYDTYSPAYYAIEIGGDLDTTNEGGFVSKLTPYLLPATAGAPAGVYREPCGTDTGGAVLAIAAGGHLRRDNDRSQTFDNGSQITYGAALSAGVSLGGKKVDNRSSRVENKTNVGQQWTNKTVGQKYLCGYKGVSPAITGTAGVIVAIGSSPTTT